MEYLTPEDYEIASQNGISHNVLTQRFYTYNWDKHRAITQPTRKRVGDLWMQYKDICAEHGISNEIFYGRVKKGKWEPKRAATTPIMTKEQRRQLLLRNRKLSPFEKVAVNNGISREAFYQRLKYGWSEEDAAKKPLREYAKQ